MPGVFSPQSPLVEHNGYVRDLRRVEAYAAALREVVKPGDVVLDLGCGTGILGVLACRAGAGHVYSVDQGPVIELARQIVRANECSDRVTLISGLSTRIELPEKVDVVVADQMSAFGLGAGLLQSFDDARKRHLKPGGVTIPSRLDLLVVPASAPLLGAELDAWLAKPAGVDVSAGHDAALNIAHLVDLEPGALLSDPQQVACWSLPLPMEGRHRTRSSFPLKKGDLHGLAGWFEARLSPSVTMTNAPSEGASIAREQVLLPISRPCAVVDDACLDVDLTFDLDHQLFNWRVAYRPSADDSSDILGDHSTFKGVLLSREQLARTQPNHLPRLDEWGQARRMVLDLCDGKHTVLTIERTVAERFGALFGSDLEVASFVADLLKRHAR